MRIIGLDIHRAFAEAVAWDDGKLKRAKAKAMRGAGRRCTPRSLRDLELKAGHKSERGQKGAAHAYNIKSHRDQERRWVEQAEAASARFVAGWNPRGPKRARTGAANEGRQ